MAATTESSASAFHVEQEKRDQLIDVLFKFLRQACAKSQDRVDIAALAGFLPASFPVTLNPKNAERYSLDDETLGILFDCADEYLPPDKRANFRDEFESIASEGVPSGDAANALEASDTSSGEPHGSDLNRSDLQELSRTAAEAPNQASPVDRLTQATPPPKNGDPWVALVTSVKQYATCVAIPDQQLERFIQDTGYHLPWRKLQELARALGLSPQQLLAARPSQNANLSP